MSWTFSTNNGSLLSLNPSARCGLSSNAFQIRPTVDFDSPLRSAILARLQCVAFFGVDSSVATTTASTWSTVMVAGRPGRASSVSPSMRCSTNRRRHLPTVGCEQPSFAATALLSAPAAQANTIRDRNANACADVARRAHRCSCTRSSVVKTSSALGRPVLGTHHSRTYLRDFRCETLDTHLIQAAWKNHGTLARHLIAQGADVNAKDSTQQSAYLVATSEGDLDLLDLTLAHGADHAAKDS